MGRSAARRAAAGGARGMDAGLPSGRLPAGHRAQQGAAAGPARGPPGPHRHGPRRSGAGPLRPPSKGSEGRSASTPGTPTPSTTWESRPGCWPRRSTSASSSWPRSRPARTSSGVSRIRRRAAPARRRRSTRRRSRPARGPWRCWWRWATSRLNAAYDEALASIRGLPRLRRGHDILYGLGVCHSYRQEHAKAPELPRSAAPGAGLGPGAPGAGQLAATDRPDLGGGDRAGSGQAPGAADASGVLPAGTGLSSAGAVCGRGRGVCQAQELVRQEGVAAEANPEQ